MEKWRSSPACSADGESETSEIDDIAEMLHQLNQPLTAINIYTQAGSRMLENGLPDPQQLKELFNKISVQSERCVMLSRKMQAYIDHNSIDHNSSRK